MTWYPSLSLTFLSQETCLLHHCNVCCGLVCVPTCFWMLFVLLPPVQGSKSWQVDIYLCHRQHKGKYTIQPPFRPPKYLKTNGRVSLPIVIVDGMPVEKWLRITWGTEKSFVVCFPTSPFALCFLTHALIGAIGRHERHDIVRLFHGIYMEMCIAHLSLPRISEPTSFPSKWLFISSPRICLGQYCLFLIRADAKTQFF